MRTVLAFAACTLAAAGPLWAQSPVHVTGPRMLLPAYVICTDLPAWSKPLPTLFIKGGHNTDGHQVMARGEIAVLNRAVDDGLRVGQSYFVRRVLSGPTRAFPREGEGFGKIHTSGWLTVTALDETNALATINHSCDSIEVGDYLEPFVELVLPTSADPMGAPIFGEYANILFGVDTRETFGDGDTLNIDRGTVHGVVPGARFAIFRNVVQGLPLVYVGDVVVMEPGELTSKAVVVRVKDVVQAGDVVVRRRNP